MFPKGYRAREEAARQRRQNRLVTPEIRAQRAAALKEATDHAAAVEADRLEALKAPVLTPIEVEQRKMATFAEPLPAHKVPRITTFADVVQKDKAPVADAAPVADEAPAAVDPVEAVEAEEADEKPAGKRGKKG